jgi:two-component system, NtrC family, sensor kinase
MRARKLLVRVAVLFLVGQLVAVVGVVFGLPAMRSVTAGPVLFAVLVGADLVLIVAVAAWLVRDAVAAPVERLSADVRRIADGDYHHRVGDPRRVELRVIQDSVNRLADRLIEDQHLLAENVRSLEETNRELFLVRDEVVRSARLASVGTLAAGIAHEVGNPLGAVIGFVDVARRRASSDGGDVEILDEIRGEALRIDRIVRGLLDYARPSPVDSAPTHPKRVIKAVRRLLESQGKLDGIDAQWLIEGGAEKAVAEPHRLEQILVNLLLNAVHAVRGVEHPRITVRLREEDGEIMQMPARREGDPLGINYMHRRRVARDETGVDAVATAARLTVVEILDNGPGVPADLVERLFDPFFTTKEPGEGTGLGLAICARLIEGMGGRIDYETRNEGGACFVIRLPLSYDIGEADDGDERAEEGSV